MAKQPATNLVTVLGFVAWGDLGPLTIYRNHRGKMVAFPKTWPKAPESALQIIQRQKFKDAAAGWRTKTPADRGEWNLCAKRAGLMMSGYALWVSWSLLPDPPAMQTLQRQTNTTLAF